MKLKITRAAVWAADVEDRPGGLAEKLGTRPGGHKSGLHSCATGTEAPGMGVVFVAPLKGATQIKAANDTGFLKTKMMHAVLWREQTDRVLAAKLQAQSPQPASAWGLLSNSDRKRLSFILR